MRENEKMRTYRQGGPSPNRPRTAMNCSLSFRVSGPGFPSPISLRSTEVTGMISMLVFVRKHSSARYNWSTG